MAALEEEARQCSDLSVERLSDSQRDCGFACARSAFEPEDVLTGITRRPILEIS